MSSSLDIDRSTLVYQKFEEVCDRESNYSKMPLLVRSKHKLAKYAEFTVIPFDTDVFEDKVYTWKKGETRKWERVLSGGTCFDAPTEYVNKRSFDGHIILTDLCAPKPKSSKCQRMWMTTATYAQRPYFSTSEKIVVVD